MSLNERRINRDGASPVRTLIHWLAFLSTALLGSSEYRHHMLWNSRLRPSAGKQRRAIHVTHKTDVNSVVERETVNMFTQVLLERYDNLDHTK